MNITRKSLLRRAALALGGISLGSLLGCGERRAIAAAVSPLCPNCNQQCEGLCAAQIGPHESYEQYQANQEAKRAKDAAWRERQELTRRLMEPQIAYNRSAAARAKADAERTASMHFYRGDSWNNHLDD